MLKFINRKALAKSKKKTAVSGYYPEDLNTLKKTPVQSKITDQ